MWMLTVNQSCQIVGNRFETDDERREVKSQVTSIQERIVILLALLFGFTFKEVLLTLICKTLSGNRGGLS